MLVKILIRRKFKPGSEEQVKALLTKFRGGAMNRPGYVSGETMVNFDDPSEQLVIGTWQTMDAWLEWKDHAERKQMEDMLALYQDGPTHYEAFVLGAPVTGS